DGTKPVGLLAKVGGWIDPSVPGTGTAVTPRVSAATGGWTTLEGSYTTDGSTYWLPDFYVALENVASPGGGAVAYIDEVDVQEDLGGGSYGVNIVAKPRAAQHLYWDQERARAYDLMLQEAETAGVTLKVVVSDQKDWILDSFDDYGNILTPPTDQHF